MKNQTVDELLMHIGFTQLESDIYLYLLAKGSRTGYAVAKGVGKPVANVYKALDTLAQKGAIEQTSGKAKQCVALPWQQLIARETKKFGANMDALAGALKRLPEHQSDEQIYEIKNANQVRDRCLRLIEQARHVILADLERQSVDWFREPLEAAAKRGVEVRIKVYEDLAITGVTTVFRPDGAQVYDKMNDLSFSISADGSEMLNALLTADGRTVIQAFRSKSVLMALNQYYKLLYELVLTELKESLRAGDLAKSQQILKDTEHLHPFTSENAVFESYKTRHTSILMQLSQDPANES